MMKKIAGLLLLATSLSGCATITRGTSQNFVIESDPAGAEAELSKSPIRKFVMRSSTLRFGA
jgi:hypothetical protein